MGRPPGCARAAEKMRDGLFLTGRAFASITHSLTMVTLNSSISRGESNAAAEETAPVRAAAKILRIKILCIVCPLAGLAAGGRTLSLSAAQTSPNFSDRDQIVVCRPLPAALLPAGTTRSRTLSSWFSPDKHESPL